MMSVLQAGRFFACSFRWRVTGNTLCFCHGAFLGRVFSTTVGGLRNRSGSRFLAPGLELFLSLASLDEQVYARYPQRLPAAFIYDARYMCPGRRVSLDASGGGPHDHQDGSRPVETELRLGHD